MKKLPPHITCESCERKFPTAPIIETFSNCQLYCDCGHLVYHPKTKPLLSAVEMLGQIGEEA